MSKYFITDGDLKNLIIFLNRVEYKGLEEVSAINKILAVLENPIEENDNIPINNNKNMEINKKK